MSDSNHKDRSSVSQTQKARHVEGDQIQIGGNAVVSNDTPKHTQSKAPFQPDPELSSSTVIFISHWSAEKSLALLLADWIKDVFQERFTVFLTSDPNAITVGEKWMDKIEKALHSAKLAL